MPLRSVALEMFGVVPGRSGGMETHAFQLARALAALRPDVGFLLGIRPQAREVLADPGARNNCELFTAPLSGPARRIPLAQSVSEWVRFQRRMTEKKVELLHAMFAVVRPPWWTRKFVVTLPDMHYRTLKGVISRPAFEMYDYHVRTTARRARLVFTLSEYSRQSIVRELGIDPRRVVAAYCGIDHARFTPLTPDETARLRKSRPDLPARFLLYPSALLPHKNHAGLLRAVERLRAAHGVNVPVVLTGTAATGFAADVLRQAEALGGQVRWAGVVPFDELLVYYRLATAVVFPSLHEGFGLPVVEAMACGTPVACSGTTSVGEVAGDAALTFDPDDPDAIASALLRVLEDGALRASLVQKGLRRAAEFSWARTAARTWAGYQAVLGEN